MRGEPRPIWTESRHRWLTILTDGPAKSTAHGSAMTVAGYACRVLKWTEEVPGRPGFSRLTDAGRAVLDGWDAMRPGSSGVPARMPRAYSPDELENVAARLVANRQVDELLAAIRDKMGPAPPTGAVVEPAERDPDALPMTWAASLGTRVAVPS